MKHAKNWEKQTQAQQIVWLGFNRQHASVNTINHEVLDELNQILQDIEQCSDLKGLVIYSLKAKGFIAGADVNVFAQEDHPEKITEFLRKGQAVLARLAALRIPTIAMIDGFCLGGGLELALACDYRIASDSKSTRLGLPEVLLGIHPGWGGTVRLPQLIGGFQALSSVMLSGKPLSAKQAKKLGFVDAVVPVRQLKRAVMYYLEHKPKLHQPTILQSLGNMRWMRRWLCTLLRREVSKKVNPVHYPAPFAMIDLWEKDSGTDDRAYLKEANSIESLVATGETAHNLTRLFFLRERLKSFAKGGDKKIKHVHVIGAGVMGGDIAAWCALQGLQVTLQDQSMENIGRAIGRASKLFSKQLPESFLAQAARDRLMPDPHGHGLGRADVIIEAVFESLEVKQTLFKHIEQLAKPDAILATNTSSIPLDSINQVMVAPERLVGIHFFNPVSQMALVEVVCGAKTTPEVIQRSCAFVGQIQRLPLPVQSCPGFLVNRVLMPYLMEAIQLLDEGYAPEQIDQAAKAYGMMMGPITLIDTIGMDVCLAVAENLMSEVGISVPQKLRDMVSSGRLGQKTAQGFYRYQSGKQVKNKRVWVDKDQVLAKRLIMKMVQESRSCIREGVVADSDLLDAGMVFATGFAPFRGGPLYDATHCPLSGLNTLSANPMADDKHNNAG